jgi:hypothetical protein
MKALLALALALLAPLSWATGSGACSVNSKTTEPGCTLNGTSSSSSSPTVTANGTATATATATATDTPLVKGAVLYCWKEKDRWVYSLVAGTNAIPARYQLHAVRVESMSELEAKLASVPPGTEVSINALRIEGLKLSSPPKAVFSKIREACEKRGLKFVASRAAE